MYSKYRMTCTEPLSVSLTGMLLLTNTHLYMYLLLFNFQQNPGMYEPTGLVAAVVGHTMLQSPHSHVRAHAPLDESGSALWVLI